MRDLVDDDKDVMIRPRRNRHRNKPSLGDNMRGNEFRFSAWGAAMDP